MLALFYFAIPVGSGLGYIVGSETAKVMGSWHFDNVDQTRLDLDTGSGIYLLEVTATDEMAVKRIVIQ